MSSNFHIQCQKRNGNLHLRPKGDFDGTSTWETIHMMRHMYEGNGRIYIDTSQLGKVLGFGCTTFRCCFREGGIPAHRLVFQGEKGGQLAPSGSKVQRNPENRPCGCTGDCANCLCKMPKRQASAKQKT